MSQSFKSDENQSLTISTYIQDRNNMHEELVNLSCRIYDVVSKLKGTNFTEDYTKDSIAKPQPSGGQIDELFLGNGKLKDITNTMNDNLIQIEMFLR